jgi:hypothetical protein
MPFGGGGWSVGGAGVVRGVWVAARVEGVVEIEFVVGLGGEVEVEAPAPRSSQHHDRHRLLPKVSHASP